MNEWACITLCNQARRLGVAGGQFPPLPMFFFFFFGMSAQSRTEMMIIPLPSGGATVAGGGGASAPLWFSILFVCFWLLAMIVPLPHYLIFWTNFWSRTKMCRETPTPPPPPPHTHTHTLRWATFRARAAVARHFWQVCPPPKQTPWCCPCPYPIMVIILPPPADCRFQSWRNTQRDILLIVEVLL